MFNSEASLGARNAKMTKRKAHTTKPVDTKSFMRHF